MIAGLAPRLSRKIRQADSGCWEWTAAMMPSGYGNLWDGTKVICAHRLVYEALVGPIPEGLELDHLCRNRKCVNPSHLEPVTRSTNMRRARNSITCRNGHLRSKAGIYGSKLGRMNCKTCKDASAAKWRAKNVDKARAYRRNWQRKNYRPVKGGLVPTPRIPGA